MELRKSAFERNEHQQRPVCRLGLKFPSLIYNISYEIIGSFYSLYLKLLRQRFVSSRMQLYVHSLRVAVGKQAMPEPHCSQPEIAGYSSVTCFIRCFANSLSENHYFIARALQVLLSLPEILIYILLRNTHPLPDYKSSGAR